ncbi:MAG: YeeE/YedE thiosulfate transporter family protein [Bacteroidota bacterium]
MLDALLQPWPWYVAGPLIGLMVPLLLLVGGRAFGVSANLRHLCAATLPTRLPFLRYDWRGSGLWNLTFALGIVLGGAFAATVLADPDPVNLAAATVAHLRSLGIEDLSGLVPAELVSWQALGTVPGLLIIVGGGFLVGFGARYAGGCTSGHAISGLANLQVPSLVAVLGFFAGGLLLTYVLLPILL